MGMGEAELVRLRCSTCGRRLVVPTDAKMVACTRCGSEYSVEKHGGTMTLSPLLDQVQEINAEIASSERLQQSGCASISFGAVGFGLIAFLVAGILGAIFNQLALGCFAGWGIALIVIFFGSAFSMRYLNENQRQLNVLTAEREAAMDAEMAAEDAAEDERQKREVQP